MSKLTYSTCLFFWIAMTFLVFFSSLKEQIIISKRLQQNISTLFPQGWGFFTKSPREPLLYVYNINNKNEKIPVMINNFSIKSNFGLSRKARFIGFEANDIIKNISSDRWKEQEYQNLNKLKPNGVFVYKKNKSYRYFENGLYLFILKATIPYAWAKEDQEKFAPFTYTFVKIE